MNCAAVTVNSILYWEYLTEHTLLFLYAMISIHLTNGKKEEAFVYKQQEQSALDQKSLKFPRENRKICTFSVVVNNQADNDTEQLTCCYLYRKVWHF